MSGNRPRRVRCHNCGGDYYGWSESGLCERCRPKPGELESRLLAIRQRRAAVKQAVSDGAMPIYLPPPGDPFAGL